MPDKNVVGFGRKDTAPKAFITPDFQKAFDLVMWSAIDIMCTRWAFVRNSGKW